MMNCRTLGAGLRVPIASAIVASAITQAYGLIDELLSVIPWRRADTTGLIAVIARVDVLAS